MFTVITETSLKWKMSCLGVQLSMGFFFIFFCMKMFMDMGSKCANIQLLASQIIFILNLHFADTVLTSCMKNMSPNHRGFVPK